MKLVSTLLAALVLLLTAQVAEAKPKAKPAPKDAFACKVTDLKIIGESDARGWQKYNALVRVACTAPKKYRIQISDVFLEDDEYETEPSDGIDMFESFYGSTPGVVYARRYVDITPGKTSDFVIYFEDVRSKWGVGLVLDLYGTKHPLPVLPH